MSEFITAPGVEAFTKLDHSADSPQTIIQQSLVVLSTPNTGDQLLTEIANKYLVNSTLVLVDHIEQGLYADVTEAANVPNRDKSLAYSSIDGSIDHAKAKEAFGIAKTIYHEMPKRLTFAFGEYHIPHNLLGSIKPPENLYDHTTRLEQLRRGIADFTNKNESDYLDYAKAFFRVGILTPEKMPTTPHEQAEEEDHRIRRMFDLPTVKNGTIFEQ